MAPSPSVFLAAVAQRTRRLRFGPMVYALPLYHPLRLIEEICMLDQMSGGRLDIGFGRGASPIELGYFGQDPAKAQSIYAEGLELVIKGMTEKTSRGSGLADKAGSAFDRIREGVAQTSELVRTIAASMSEQREGAEEILRSSQSLADATRLIEGLAEGQKAQSKGMEQSMLRIVSASNEIFEAVQEETGATQSLGRIVALVGEEAGRNSERVLGLEEAVSRFKTGAGI
jgi:alkanesulfonate monooxygenase SsuD/methylene tetrahydromethanopterin reductase-like flavin-dependent oxidoreductase (luciferase family)